MTDAVSCNAVDELQTEALISAHRQRKIIAECHAILDALERDLETEEQAP